MRTAKERIKHAALFELLGILLVTPLGAWLLDKEMTQVGGLAVALSLIAMAGNYVYNLGFDYVLLKLNHPLNVRPPWLRVVHSVLFEAFLLLLLLPVIAYWLEVTLLQAFIADLGFAAFFLVYAYVYNWVYDRFYPMEAR